EDPLRPVEVCLAKELAESLRAHDVPDRHVHLDRVSAFRIEGEFFLGDLRAEGHYVSVVVLVQHVAFDQRGLAHGVLAHEAAFLLVAAASDFRTRRVRDPLWIGLGTLGLVVLASQLVVESAPWSAWSFAGSAALLFYAVFFGRPLTEEDGFHARPVRIALFLVAGVMWIAPLVVTGAVPATGSTPAMASTPVMIVTYQALYRLRVLHGGADAKGLMAITLLVPTYPNALPFPLLVADPRVDSGLRIVFPFSLVVWVDAAIVSLAIPVGLFIFNALRR